ncbi:MAG: S8 family serine peptidase [Candidatus Aminicenantes bacterium]|nr:S8 family serine peptidase [Candidatus Aminicenantes bacterium]
MGNKRILLSVLALVAAGFLLSSGGSSAGDNPAMSYMLIFQYADLPEGLGQQIALANGEMTADIKQIGVAVASSSDAKFIDKASRISGIRSVVLDPVVEWSQEPIVEEMTDSDPYLTFDPKFDLQWNLFKIHAGPGFDDLGVWTPGAWDLGARGKGARVFVLDGGINSQNLDISPNLNTSLCQSFVPGEGWDVSPGINNYHGTHVAGIIAAAKNDWGIMGVAPEAELVAVKVLSGRNSGTGLLSYLNQGIVYAADNGADVINMSLGGLLPSRSGWWVGDIHVTAKMVGEMLHATQRAITYAYQKGATLVAAAGNFAIDADHDQNAVIVPAQLAHVIAVSATDAWDGPWYLNNYGQSLVSFAAPGAWILSDINKNKFAYLDGTSQAAAHVSGVAALIIGQNGGFFNPAQVESVLKQSADDLGKPGNDDYYGMGRVNAYKAVLYSK